MSPDANSSRIAFSRVASYPCVGVRSSCSPYESVHIHGVPAGAVVGLEDAADDKSVSADDVVVVSTFGSRPAF
jgi:hypothetical protein